MHGDKCRNKHPDRVCNDRNCTEDQCYKRRPNPCKFGMRCKFNKKKVCSFAIRERDDKVTEIQEVFEKRIKDLNDNVEGKWKKIQELENKLKDFKKEELKKKLKDF